MPRSPNASALTKIQTALGTEPIFIVEVDWTHTHRYADKDFLGIRGTILSVSGLDAIIKLGGGGASGSLSITLDDTDGTIKALLNENDIHKRPARVYQTYEGLALGDEFLLFSGEVSSPIEWNESERTISFDIVAEIEDRQLGFSPEQGEFDFISDSAIGVPWPLCFGSVIRVPAVKITEAVRGTSLTRYGAITIPELEQLCSLAVTLQRAESAKAVADGSPGYSDTNYATTVDELSSAWLALDSYLDGLIEDSPTQETNLREYVEICKEIERWRIFHKDQLAAKVDAENRITPLQTTSGQSAVTSTQFFHPTSLVLTQKQLDDYIKNDAFGDVERIVKTSTEFEEVKNELKFKKVAKQYVVDIYPARSASTGAVDDALTELNNWRALYYPYAGHLDESKLGPSGNPPSEVFGFCTASEETAEDIRLNNVYGDLLAQLNEAIGDSAAAGSFMVLATNNIASLLSDKANLEDTLTDLVITQIVVDGGDEFPQGVLVEIVVNGMHFTGTFSGQVFTVTEANIPADTNVAISATSEPNEFTLADPTILLKGKYCYIPNSGLTFVDTQDGATCRISPIFYRQTGTVTDGIVILSHDVYEAESPSGSIAETSVFIRDHWLDTIRATNKPDFATGLSLLRIRDYGIDVGDTVFLASDYKEIYVANLIPSTTIHEVMAYRTIDGVRKLVPIPSQYFEINLNESIAGQNATTLRFNRPLTEYHGENWEDDIYVTLTSTVGPNTVDIIEHLVDTYTDLTADTSSFTSVHTSVDPFPSDFAYLDRRSTLTAIEEIAWQARCVAYVKDGTIFLKYLAVEEAALETIDETVADRESFVLTLTPTEDLVTEFRAEWDFDYERSKNDRRNEIVLRNNIPKYGLNEQTFDIYIYNQKDLVIHTSIFWLIRYSNTWKIARFSAPLTMLRAESLDTVELDFANDFIASGPVKGVVTQVTYNSESFVLEFEVQSSVRAGELDTYVFTWPANVDVSIEYPTEDDPYAGGAS